MNEFAPLFKQICVGDCYRIRQVPFTPDAILDIGANVGTFTSYVRFLFPEAFIIAMEPNPRNWQLLLQHTGHFPSVLHVNMALGIGRVSRAKINRKSPWYGGMESYLSEVLAPRACDYEQAGLGMPLDAILYKWPPQSSKLLIKIDIEGGEDYIFTHPPSIAALRRADYLVMELHTEPHTPVVPGDPSTTIGDVLMSLSDTHDCLLEPERNYFQATRKGL